MTAQARREVERHSPDWVEALIYRAVRDEREVVQLEVERLEAELDEARVRLSNAVVLTDDRREEVWRELMTLGVAGRKEAAVVGWLTGPAGKSKLAEWGMLQAEVIELYREKWGAIAPRRGD